MNETFTLEPKVKDLILGALGANYTSVVCKHGVRIEAGNHYQSVALGEFKTQGFRDDRAKIFDQLDFEGKKVLDLGSNLGELSRAARLRGASLVDGFEIDTYFLEIADLINVYTGVTRVSFYQRDIGDPATFVEPYDIVLAFAVFGQGAGRTLESLAEVTDVLVVETHRLEGNLESGYMAPVAQYFPYHRMLGESDWGSTFDRHEIRAVIIFAKTEEALRGALKEDMPQVLHAGGAPAADAAETGDIRLMDVSRTRLQEKFFSTFEFDSSEDLLTAVDRMEVDVGTLARSHDSRFAGYDGWVLWLLYLKGFLQYSKTKEVGPGNAYFEYVSEYHEQVGDPVVSLEVGWDTAAEYVKRQFENMDRMRSRASDPALVEEIPPLRAIVKDDQKGTLYLYEPGAEHPIVAARVDGWHRLFAARVFDVPHLRIEVSEEPEPTPVYGALEDMRFDGSRLEISGWCVHPSRKLHTMEVSYEGTPLGYANAIYRDEISETFPQLPLRRTGFVLDTELTSQAKELIGDPPVRFGLTALHEWLPFGSMDLFYVPRMFERRSPPRKLAARHVGTDDPRRLVIDSLRCLHAMLEPIRRYRGLDSFGGLLDWGCGVGMLESALGYFLGEVSVTAVDSDQEGIDWCRDSGIRGEFGVVPELPPTGFPDGAFDLVLGYGTLTRMPRDAQLAWIEELKRVMQPGGYAALSFLGELVRPLLNDDAVREDLDGEGISDRGVLEGEPWEHEQILPRHATYQTRDYTVREFGKLFDVISYVEGGVNNKHDLIVLRRP
jgi:SAM-dependent methyltransferase